MSDPSRPALFHLTEDERNELLEKARSGDPTSKDILKLLIRNTMIEYIEDLERPKTAWEHLLGNLE